MADYAYDSELVADPFSFLRAANSAITIYDVLDTNKTTPLPLKDLSGLALPNPLTSNADAFVPAFIAPAPQVKMFGGGLEVVRSSFQGVRDAAVEAASSAESSAASAAEAALHAQAPTDAQVDAGVARANIPGQVAAVVPGQVATAVPPVVAAALASDPSVANGAAALAQNAAALIPAWKPNTAYTAGARVIAPNGDVVSAKVNFTSAAAYSAANWNGSTQDGRIVVLEAAKWDKGELPANTNVNNMYNATDVGSWKISSAPSSRGITGLPPGVDLPGNLEMSPGIGYHMYRVYNTNQLWYRSMLSVTSKSWNVWKDLNVDALPLKGNIPNGTDMNTLFTPAHQGIWDIASSASAATMTNLPGTPKAGKVIIFNIAGGGIATQDVMYYGGERHYRAVSNLTGPVWASWRDMFPAAAVSVVTEPGLKHQLRSNTAKAVSGGPLGTGGKPFIVLRFDDWHAEFGSVVAPVLRENNLPCVMACTVDMVAASVGAAQIQSWHVNDGFKVVNHSYSHGPASTDAQLVHEIIESADAHEANMSSIRIHEWMMPGTGTGVPYGGYDDSIESAFWTTAGKLLMSRYGFIWGSRGGYLAPQGGAVIGQGHTTFEASSLVSFQAVVNAAKKGAYSLTLMAHPYRFGTAGYMSIADFTAAMAWLAAERDAGNIMVGSATAVMALDPNSTRRHNLLPGPFESMTGWTGSGWAVAGGIAAGPASTATLSTTARWDACPSVKGGVRETHIRVRSSAGNSIKIRLSNAAGTLTTEKTFAVPGDGQWHDLRKFFSIPVQNSADNLGASVFFNSTTGVPFEIQEANMFAS